VPLDLPANARPWSRLCRNALAGDLATAVTKFDSRMELGHLEWLVGRTVRFGRNQYKSIRKPGTQAQYHLSLTNVAAHFKRML
jgi:hypothetical protein